MLSQAELGNEGKFVGATVWIESMTWEFAEIEMVRKTHHTLLNHAELSTRRC